MLWMGKSTNWTGHGFNSKLLFYQRVDHEANSEKSLGEAAVVNLCGKHQPETWGHWLRYKLSRLQDLIFAWIFACIFFLHDYRKNSYCYSWYYGCSIVYVCLCCLVLGWALFFWGYYMLLLGLTIYLTTVGFRQFPRWTCWQCRSTSGRPVTLWWWLT